MNGYNNSNAVLKAETDVLNFEKREIMLDTNDRKSILSLKVASQSFFLISNLMNKMMNAVIDAKQNGNNSRNNFRFHETLKEIDEIVHTTEINSTKILYGEEKIIVDKMKNNDESIFKPCYGIDNILIDEAIHIKAFKIFYSKKNNSLAVSNAINGSTQYINFESLRGKDHVAFNSMKVGLIINENLEQFKLLDEQNAFSNVCYGIRNVYSKQELLISNLKMINYDGYIGDITSNKITYSKIATNKFKLIIEAENGDFFCYINQENLTENSTVTLKFERIFQGTKFNDIRRDFIYFEMTIEKNSLQPIENNAENMQEHDDSKNIYLMHEQKSMNGIFAKLNEIRNTIFMYKKLKPSIFSFNFSDLYNPIDVEINPINSATTELSNEDLYTNESAEHAFLVLSKAMTMLQTELTKINSIISLIDAREKILINFN